MNFADPNVLEAEKLLVTTCAYRPKVLDLAEVEPGDFFAPLWKDSWSKLRELHQAGEQIDPLILSDSVPGLEFTDLAIENVSTSLVPRYARLISDAACKRRLVLALGEVTEAAKAGENAEELLSRTALALSDASLGQPEEARNINSILEARFIELGRIAELKAKGEAAAIGIPSGIAKLDEYTCGWQRGIMSLVAARPAMGKSMLALNVTEHATAQGIGVHLFSLEDTSDAYADRVLAYHSGIDTMQIRRCEFNKGELQNIGIAKQKLVGRKNWLVDERSGITAEEIVRAVRKNRERNKTELVLVDYIQLLGWHQGCFREVDALNHAAQVFANAAKQDRIAYVVLSQLNRELMKRENKRPVLSDLKGCGGLEEKSKCVVMLHRPAYYDDGSGFEDVDPALLELHLVKNSNGPTTYVDTHVDAATMRIS